MLWQDLLLEIREDMRDTSERLTDDRATLYAKYAIREYSRWNPRVLSETLDVDEDGKIPLPEGFLSVIELRNAASDALIKPLIGSSSPPTRTLSSSSYLWWLEGSSIRINTWADAPDQVHLLYNGHHAIPTAATATGMEMTFPPQDSELIVLYVRAKEMEGIRSKTAQLDRYKRRTDAGNTRLDNPLRPEEADLMHDFYRLIHQRYGSSGSIRLRKRVL